MKFTPKSQQTIKDSQLVPKGIYQCRISQARDDRSQFQSDMLVLYLDILDDDGEFVGKVIDRITGNMKAGGKLRDFCVAFNLVDTYEAGELKAAQCIGRQARCKVYIKRSQKYGDKSEIEEYLAADVAMVE